MKITTKDIAKMIDHSLLKPEMTENDIIDGCNIAKVYDVASVCVKPCFVKLAKELLKDTNVLVGTVIGFPHGSNTTSIKVAEAIETIKDGAVELDMVLNIGLLKSGSYDKVEADIKTVVDAAHKNGAIVKVILENCYLTELEKSIACKLCESAGADYVKTSTGYGTGGATIEDLKLMRKTCSPKVKVKAAGGIRTLESAIEVRKVGTVRFGCTTTASLLEAAKKHEAEGTLEDLI